MGRILEDVNYIGLEDWTGLLWFRIGESGG
jgi:hypothetical protein